MSGSEFRDVLERAIDLPARESHDAAVAVLSTPEMQAIRRALRLCAFEEGALTGIDARLPASVIEWVLAEEVGDE